MEKKKRPLRLEGKEKTIFILYLSVTSVFSLLSLPFTPTHLFVDKATSMVTLTFIFLITYKIKNVNVQNKKRKMYEIKNATRRILKHYITSNIKNIT